MTMKTKYLVRKIETCPVCKRWPYGDPPPEEELCGECEGTGTIETEVDLLDALDELGVYMPSFWSERAEAKQGVPC